MTVNAFTNILSGGWCGPGSLGGQIRCDVLWDFVNAPVEQESEAKPRFSVRVGLIEYSRVLTCVYSLWVYGGEKLVIVTPCYRYQRRGIK